VASLRQILEEQIPQKQADFAKLKKEHGDVGLGTVTIDQVRGCMQILQISICVAHDVPCIFSARGTAYTNCCV
jgi:hypothetical protein